MPERTCASCGERRFIKARELCTRCYQRPGREQFARTRARTFDEWMTDVVRDPDGCERWTGPTSTEGYGYLRTGGVLLWVHQEVWRRSNGEIPAGHEPDHTCRVRHCTRLDHLELVTGAENRRRGVPFRKPSKPRVGRCSHGDRDVYVDPTGKRVCRICRRARVKLWKADVAGRAS